jgi:hypothetical protein
MSLEKMIRGKFLSMMAQFLFGFFCIVPFLFFSYLLGGLDFYTILSALILLAILFPPLFLFALTVALYSHQVKALSILFRVGGLLLLIFGGLMAFRVVIFLALVAGSHGGTIFNMAEIVKTILAGGYEPHAWMGGFVFFHVLFCLLLFYLCCNAIAPVSDSREGAIKFLATVFCLGLMFSGLLIFLYTNEDILFRFLLFVFPIECLMGFLYFWGPLEVPLMAQRRQNESNWTTVRWGTYWFQAGPAGTFRTLLLLWGGALTLYLTAKGITYLYVEETTERLLLLLLTVPFWITLPGYFLVHSKRFRQSPMFRRMTLFVWWGLGGILMFLVFQIHKSIFGDSESLALELLSPISTPVSAFVISLSDDVSDAPTFFWSFLGIMGMFQMIRTLSAWIRFDRMDRETILEDVSQRVHPKTATPPPVPALTPEGGA